MRPRQRPGVFTRGRVGFAARSQVRVGGSPVAQSHSHVRRTGSLHLCHLSNHTPQEGEEKKDIFKN